MNFTIIKNYVECIGNFFFYIYTILPYFSFQTVNKVLIVYADVVKQDFEKYTNDHKKVSP